MLKYFPEPGGIKPFIKILIHGQLFSIARPFYFFSRSLGAEAERWAISAAVLLIMSWDSRLCNGTRIIFCPWPIVPFYVDFGMRLKAPKDGP